MVKTTIVRKGYTLLANGSSVWIQPLLQKMPWDPVRDLAPIAQTSRDVKVLIVHPSLPVRSTKELIALAKARPGELNYASGGSPVSLLIFVLGKRETVVRLL